MRASTVAITALVATCASTAATAATTPGRLDGEQGLVTATGERTGAQRQLSFEVPFSAARGMAALAAELGSGWHGYFDLRTGVPGRLYGGSAAAPGAMASAAIAEDIARGVLARHLALLAPGARAEDFVLSANDLSSGLRTVAFVQTHAGMRVLGGQLSFRFKNDRLFLIGSEALPAVDASPVAPVVRADRAQAEAQRWIARDFGPSAKASAVGSPVVLPIFAAAGLRYATVLEVRVDTVAPILRFAVYVDAASGAPVARRQTLMFADGTVLINAPERHPGGTRSDVAAPHMAVTVDGSQAETDAAGLLTWAGSADAQATLHVNGSLVQVNNGAGAEITQTITLSPGGSYAWNQATVELSDAQLITYIAAHTVKARCKLIAPTMQWLDDVVQANVNQNDTCNAFSDGESINFFVASRQCENTGRITDVVYHEFGHSFHAHAIIPGAGDFDGALSEGISDYLAATITGDHGMGRGFFFSNDALRDIDPTGSEAHWPEDISQDPHETGLIIAGALWDLRKTLITSMGQAAGVAYTDNLMYQMLKTASDIPSSYAEVVAADDDDGNLGNGTPNICAINDAFTRHGLGDPNSAGPGIGRPQLSGLTVTLPVQAGMACPGATIQSATLTWKLRATPAQTGVVTMTAGGAGYSGDIPRPADGEVVQYQVQVVLASGDSVTYPDNAADPWYETYVGAVTPIYCTDFERDPGPEGWSHALVSGTASQGADDWTWGAPQAGVDSGDPTAAYSGTNVYGNDLGGGNFNGKYQSDKTNALTGPEVDVHAYSQVRLQYRRWLTVEDGFFDKARIVANNQTLWANLATNSRGNTAHEDKEWRFQDVDLSGSITDGRVRVRFELESDGGLEFGGWTIDDFCIVGVTPATGPVCGNGQPEQGEACDDGNAVNGDGCETNCTLSPPPNAVCGNGQLEQGEACDDGNAVNGDGCETSCTLTPGNTAMCGNGVLEQGEACDDGNAVNGDGCEAACTVTPGTMMPMNPQQPTTLESHEGGCGCESTGSRGAPGAMLLALGLLLLLRRRR